jgi:hypothetical protein
MPLRLHDRRTQLLAAYAALLAVFYATYALPDGPHFRSAGEGVFAIAIDIVLFAFVARGSRVALAIALALNLLFFASVLALTLWPPSVELVALFAVKLAETVVLVTLWRIPRGAADGVRAA